MKTLLISTFLLIFSQVAFANTCVDLSQYKLGAGSSQSEIDDFNERKFAIYREFVLSENTINTRHSQAVQRLYQEGLGQRQLDREIKNLEKKKSNQIKANCNKFNKKLRQLKANF